jgi:hypothetical protein
VSDSHVLSADRFHGSSQFVPSQLLLLLDDIATILDDVAVMGA